jgi:hypothetical protein
MSPFDLLIVLALVGYAVYRQTRRHEIEPRSRFTLTIIYAVIGIAVGGFAAPTSAAAMALLGTSLLLSVAVGALRARYTRVWLEGTSAWTQGTSRSSSSSARSRTSPTCPGPVVSARSWS